MFPEPSLSDIAHIRSLEECIEIYAEKKFWKGFSLGMGFAILIYSQGRLNFPILRLDLLGKAKILGKNFGLLLYYGYNHVKDKYFSDNNNSQRINYEEEVK